MIRDPIVLVEDDSDLREALRTVLERNDHRVISVSNGPDALEVIRRESVAMVVSDVQMEPWSGLELLSHIQAYAPQIPFVLMTAFANVKQAVRAINQGAMDYLVKPVETKKLLATVERYCRPRHVDTNLVAVDPKTRQLLGLAEQVAKSDVNVMLAGPSGSGKEAFARFIHESSERREKPFVAVNCAAIPEQMLEAELFGYERGAFTGAVQSRVGKFEHAQGGTLLLDEISEMDTSMQAKLLRVLQERELERLGGNRRVRLDVRVIATSNRDLVAAVEQGEFREDLYYRLNVFPLHLPPLGERSADVIPLAERSLEKHWRGQGPVPVLADEARDALQAHNWPGNVRELDNVIQRAMVLSGGRREIGLDDLSLGAADEKRVSDQAPGEVGQDVSRPEAHPSRHDCLQARLERREWETILETMRAYGGHRGKVASRLGISPRTLRYKLSRMREAGIDFYQDGRSPSLATGG